MKKKKLTRANKVNERIWITEPLTSLFAASLFLLSSVMAAESELP